MLFRSKTVNKKTGREYATVSDDEGVDYRTIAETMTVLGHKMNHSSARNHVVRVMRKFVDAYSDAWGVDLTEEQADSIARSPMFQSGVYGAIDRLLNRP